MAKKADNTKKKKKPVETNGGATQNDMPDWVSSAIGTDDVDLENVDVGATPIELPNVVKPSVKSVVTASSPKPAAKKGSASGGQDLKASEQGGEMQVNIPQELGIIALRNATVFPGTVMPLAIGRPRSRSLLGAMAEAGALNPDNPIGVLTQIDPKMEKPGANQLYQVGTVVTILKLLKMPEGQNSIVVHGLIRFRVVQWLATEPFLRARIEVLTSHFTPSKELTAMINNVRQMARQMIQLSPNIPEEVQVILDNIDDPGALADFLSANININLEQKQHLLEETDVEKRLHTLSVALANQLELLKLGQKLHQQVSKSIDKTQREYFLQEQLKAIQSELGQTDQKTAEVEELREAVKKADMPEKVNEEVLRELDRLDKIPMMSPEFNVLRTYIEWLCELPWALSTEEKLNLKTARRILDQDHYDLVKVKKRILEFLAVRKLNPQGRSPILCFVGPPGVGKTSLGRSIARSMGRKFIRISLGGIRDEADIRGHRRTYIGALPGRIMQELRKCKSNNPVFMLDELDKIGQDFRGDPASALLEVLDPEQNNSFTDHYIDQPFDLSKVMFIGTANIMDPVPPALRDRMEVIELPGYTHEDKMFIATKYLVPRQLQENGLKAGRFKITSDALRTLIQSYTREAGVRELERKIGAVCRAIAAEVASGKRKTATVSAGTLGKLLGPIRYESELALRRGTPGVVTGLAYTPSGGEILFIEATLLPGAGKLILTGQLGEVMKESAQAALSAIKSIGACHGRRPKGLLAEICTALEEYESLAKHDVHIHVPAGAVPKDGPSAGVAIYTALASLLTGRPARPDVAMTGEITLRGLVLPIGGVKEKTLGAKRAGIKTIILPERNKKDLVDLPKFATKGITFKFVKQAPTVLDMVLV
ncbi:MAG: endopeptidase La [Sedimentisphaerales bacterium]|nr:endopeptidase La [Sedimentisphaerales bacterium]